MSLDSLDETDKRNRCDHCGAPLSDGRTVWGIVPQDDEPRYVRLLCKVCAGRPR
jgi:RNase P subunit RPR2